MIKSAYIHIPFCNNICFYCAFCKMLKNDAFVDKYLNSLEKEIKKIIIFWWNKIYPADMFFDLSLDQWQLVETKEFEGSSHQITEEIYIKGERE